MKRQNLRFLLAAGLPVLVLSVLVILWKGSQEGAIKAPTAAARQDVTIPKFYRVSHKDAFAIFSDWAETYRASSMQQKKSLLDSGAAFAKQRAV